MSLSYNVKEHAERIKQKLLQKQQGDVQINTNTNMDEKETQNHHHHHHTSALIPQCKVFTFQTPLPINPDDDTDKNQNQHLIKGITSFQQIDSILTDTFIKPTPDVICIDSDDDDVDIDEHIYRTHDHQNISRVHTALKTEPVNRNLINSVRDKFKNKQNQNQNLVENQNMNALQKQKSQMSSFQLALLHAASSSSSSSYTESPSSSIYNDPIDTMKLEDIKQYDCVSPSSFINTVPSSSVTINPDKVLDQLQLHPGLEDVENTIRQYLEKEKQEMEQKIESQQNKDKDKDEAPKSKSMKYKEDDAITLRMKKSLEKMNLQLEQSIIRDFEWNLDCDLS